LHVQRHKKTEKKSFRFHLSKKTSLKEILYVPY
jgi:hypothetical protein